MAAADEARRRLERDLHDGAQQHLVSAALTLKQAEARARGTSAEPLVTEALEQVRMALTELRDLARGIHPSVLSERGLAAAVRALVARSPLPVDLDVTQAAPAWWRARASRVSPTGWRRWAGRCRCTVRAASERASAPGRRCPPSTGTVYVLLRPGPRPTPA